MLALRRHGFSTTVAPITGAASLIARAPLAIDISQGAAADWFPNYPMMSFCTVQGVVTDNLLDPTMHDYIADYDGHMFQSFYPTVQRSTSRVSNMILVHNIRPEVKFLMYQNTNQCLKTNALQQQSALEVNRDFIASQTDGDPNWHLHRIPPNAGQTLEPNFDQVNNRQCNMARNAGTNSHGETYFQTYWRKWDELLNTANPATNVRNHLAGFFCDNYNARPPNVWINSGASQITDYDMDLNGVIDARADFSSGPNAGGRKWSEGHIDSRDAMATRFPGFVMMVNSAQWDGDYLDGIGAPPLPLSQHPFYHRYELCLAESRNLNTGIGKTATAYTATPGSLSRLYRGLEIQRRMLRPDAANTLTGRSCVMLHTNALDNSPPTQDDLEYARFYVALALLIENCANSVQSNASRPLPLDERLLYLGDPIGTRSMGTLNDNTALFQAKIPTTTFANNCVKIGVAEFYVAEFTDGVVVVRGDYPPGPYPVTPYPSSAPAVAFPLSTLVPAGAGRTWRMPNGANYVNPKTGRAMRNQSPSINNGATVTSVSMPPLHARFIRRI